MNQVNNHKQLLIGKKLARTANTPGTTLATASFMADGEIFVTDVDGTIVDSTNVLTYGNPNVRRIVQGQGATLPIIISADIYKPGVISYTGKAYTAAVQQIDYIGYNPALTAGSFDVIAGNTYIIRTRDKSNFYQFSDKEMLTIGSYNVKSTDTQEEIAYGLCYNLVLNSQNQVLVSYKAERVCNDAGVAIGAAGDTLVGTKGSKTLTYTSLGASAAITAGMYIRLGTALTAVVYKVTASTVAVNASGTITLDIPLQTNVSLLGTTSEYITAALAATANFGIKLTGLPQSKFAAGTFRYEIAKWVTTIADAGTTQVASPSTVPSEGSGTYEQIAGSEWFLQFGEGFADSTYMQVPNITFRKNVELTGTYTIINLKWSTQPGSDAITNPRAFKELDLAFNALGGNGTQYTGVVTSVQTVLNAWLPAFTALNL